MSRLLFCSLIILALAHLASADNVNQLLTVDLQMDCSGGSACYSDPGAYGSPATAWADFTLVGDPWAFNTTTANALSWVYVGDSYFATFGYGGVFDMSGPEGFTFTGVVTSGTAEFTFNSWDVHVTYFGQWSNGLYGDGIADVHIGNGGVETMASLTSQIAPEPSSFVLLGTGILGLWRWGRRLTQ
jgi:hypothetical protein